MATQITTRQFETFLKEFCERKKTSLHAISKIMKMDYRNFLRAVKDKEGSIKKKVEILKNIGFIAKHKTIISIEREKTGKQWNRGNIEQ